MSRLRPAPDRTGTGSLKWQKYEQTDVLPMWVADMDLLSPPEVMEALQARLDHGVYGYTVPYDEVNNEFIAYMKRRHQVEVSAESLFWLPGLVQGLNLVCRAAGQEGDAVMVNTPVYPPFLSAPTQSDRRRIAVPLKEGEHARWNFDREAMEAAVTEDTKLFILCNPHNPVGRVFPREELEWLLDFCEAHDLWVCADEIHCDLIFDDVEHVPFLSLGERAAKRTISFYSASKTYNLPGLACATAVIPNPEIYKAFQKVCRGIITEVNCFGYAAHIAAYRHGEPWRQELLGLLRSNRDYLATHMAVKYPQIRMPHIEATYLAWLDLRALELDAPMAHFEKHGLGLSNGMDFGAEKGHLRLNFGCPRSQLQEALARFDAALKA